MTSIYDDVFYVENMNGNEREENDDNNSNAKVDTPEVENDVIEILNCINRKIMYEKLLKETLNELNKTNPCLESGKYHMLCIYTGRYNKYINRIEDEILWYELERLRRAKKQTPKSWFWSWKLMNYFKSEYYEQEPKFVEKLLKEKKND